MNVKRLAYVLSIAAFAISAAPLPARAVEWELGLAEIGSQTSIQIRRCDTGQVSTALTHTPNPNTCGSNITISFNSAGVGDIHLLPAVDYIFSFPDGKSVRVRGTYGDPGNNDDVFQFHPDRPPDRPAGCILQSNTQIVDGWPNATCPPPPPQPLQVSLTVDSTVPVGDKTVFHLKADASFGTGSYTFSWTQAAMSTGPSVDPSFATRTLLPGQSATVTVTVVSGSYTVTKSILISLAP
jgi:hypothetical protein